MHCKLRTRSYYICLSKTNWNFNCLLYFSFWWLFFLTHLILPTKQQPKKKYVKCKIYLLCVFSYHIDQPEQKAIRNFLKIYIGVNCKTYCYNFICFVICICCQVKIIMLLRQRYLILLLFIFFSYFYIATTLFIRIWENFL